MYHVKISQPRRNIITDSAYCTVPYRIKSIYQRGKTEEDYLLVHHHDTVHQRTRFNLQWLPYEQGICIIILALNYLYTRSEFFVQFAQLTVARVPTDATQQLDRADKTTWHGRIVLAASSQLARRSCTPVQLYILEIIIYEEINPHEVISTDKVLNEFFMGFFYASQNTTSKQERSQEKKIQPRQALLWLTCYRQVDMCA